MPQKELSAHASLLRFAITFSTIVCLTLPLARAHAQDVGPIGSVTGTVTNAGGAPQRRVTATVDLLNAFQSIGLEEGNPRLALLAGGRTSGLFLARPILPRRFQVSMRYDY